MTEDARERFSRRQALKRVAAAGTVVWVAPAVQTFNMSRAFAQTQASPVTVCTKFRIVKNETTPDPNDGACTTAISPQTTCLPATSDTASCSAVVGTPSAPDGAEWVVCLQSGCEVEAVALSAASACWLSLQNPSNHNQGLPVPSNGTGTWVGWSVDGSNCLHVPRPIRDSNGQPINISHFDAIVCCPSS